MTEISRRMTLAWMAAAAASPFALNSGASAQGAAQHGAWPQDIPAPVTAPGYGTDPDMLNPTVPWTLTLTPGQRATVQAMAGLMLPADSHSPSAATLPVDAFVDEWISAPYPVQRDDRDLILPGLSWLDAESQARFQHGFAAASDAERRAIFDDVAFRGRAKPGYEKPAQFFVRIRGLMLAGFYSLPEGMADIGYIGNMPSADPYPGPPADAKAHLNAALSKLGLKTV